MAPTPTSARCSDGSAGLGVGDLFGVRRLQEMLWLEGVLFFWDPCLAVEGVALARELERSPNPDLSLAFGPFPKVMPANCGLSTWRALQNSIDNLGRERKDADDEGDIVSIKLWIIQSICGGFYINICRLHLRFLFRNCRSRLWEFKKLFEVQLGLIRKLASPPSSTTVSVVSFRRSARWQPRWCESFK